MNTTVRMSKNKPKKRKQLRNPFPKISTTRMWANYCEYMRESTLHGFKYVGNSQITWLERIYFVAAIVMVFGMSVYFISENFTKWSKQPILMSVGPHSVAITEFPFSAVTICNVNQALRSAVSRIEPSENREFLLKTMCGTHSKEDYENVTVKWPEYQQFMLNVSQPCAAMLRECTFGSKAFNCMKLFASMLTDDGLCCTFNSVHPKFLIQPTKFGTENLFVDSHKILDGTPVHWTPEFGYPTDTVHSTRFYPRPAKGPGQPMGLWLTLDANTPEYYCSMSSSEGFKVVLHDPTESPKVLDFGFAVPIGHESRVIIQPVIVNSTPDVRSIPPAKRECFFVDEFRLDYYRTYSRRNCQRECESKFVENACHCVHYAMPRTSDSTRICHQNSTECYERSMKELMKNPRTCDFCLPSCSEMSFSSSVSSSRLWLKDDWVKSLNVTENYFS